MEFALVLWRRGKTTGVVPSSSLQHIRNGTEVKWIDENFYHARVLALANDPDDLHSLSVDDEGVISFYPLEETSFDSSSRQESESFCTGTRTDVPQNSSKAVQTMSTCVESEADRLQRDSKAPSTESKMTQTDLPQPYRKVSSISTDVQINLLELLTERRSSPDANAHVDAASDITRLNNDTSAMAPRKSNDESDKDGGRGENDAGTDTDNDSSASSDDDKQMSDPWTRNGPGRKKLVSAYNVYVVENELNEILEKFLKKPEEFVRRLMRLIVTRELLVQMTVTGRGENRRKIPPEVIAAVKKFMEENMEPNYWLTRSQFRQVLTRMCNKLREMARN